MGSNDTIVASATASGRGAVSVIRLSGDKAIAIGQRLAGRSLKPRTAHYGQLTLNGVQIDSGLWLCFPKPRSFTGENVVEFQGHGGPVVIQQCIQAMIELGARPAQPGEFSERAFLNEKMDLTQAEAIADLIDASSIDAVHAANRSLQGAFGQEIENIVREIITVRTHIEAHIDFPDEEISPTAIDQIHNQMLNIQDQLARTSQSADIGTKLTQATQILLLGAPNSGKSSLLNALAREPLAIVTDVPGTTRDLIRHEIVIHGLQLNITDSAGIRDTTDPIEFEGIQRARQAIEGAHIILCLFDGECQSEVSNNAVESLLGAPVDTLQTILVLHSKKDIVSRPLINNTPFEAIGLSAKTGEGIDKLIDWFSSKIRASQTTENVFSARTRHLTQIHKASEYLAAALSNPLTSEALDLIAEDLRLTQTALSEITGRFTSDDLLSEIFSTFCIGK